MKRSFEDVLTISQREKVDMRRAALMLGLEEWLPPLII